MISIEIQDFIVFHNIRTTLTRSLFPSYQSDVPNHLCSVDGDDRHDVRTRRLQAVRNRLGPAMARPPC